LTGDTVPPIPVLDLPAGPHRDLVIALQELHAAAGWPSTRSISKIECDEFPATLSHERVRAVLSGKALPRWETLETLVRALSVIRRLDDQSIEVDVDRFMSLWKAASIGEYGALQQLFHGDSAGSVYGDGSQWVATDIARILVNPIYSIEIDPQLAFPHEPIISEEEWIQVNLRMIAEIGPEGFLRALLNILKGGWIASSSFGSDDDDRHVDIDAEIIDRYIVEKVFSRLEAEPNLLARSAARVHERDADINADVRAEIEELESEAYVLREAMAALPENWDNLSFEAQRLVILYLIDHAIIGSSNSEIDQQVNIIWRISPS
jgi:hypothetical protein